jgi:hypothetical protein
MSAPLPTASRWNTYSRSRYPRLWDGCVAAYCPSLGVTGSRYHDYAIGYDFADTTSVTASTAWVVENGGYAVSLPNGGWAQGSKVIPATSRRSIALWARNTYSFTADQQYSPLCNVGAVAIGQFFAPIISTATLAGGNGSTGFGFGVSQYGDSAGTFVNDFLWHHLTIVNVDSLWSVYLDGVFKTSKTMTTTPVANFLLIGAATTSVGFNNVTFGHVWDDLRYYTRDLHPEEIRLLARRRAIAYEPAYQPAYYMEPEAAGGVAKPVLFHSYYMNQGMRP